MLSIVIEESSGIDRDREPLTLGVPLPQGTLFDDRCLSLSDEHGQSLPVQTQVLDRWSDQSCRWVLLDFQASVLANQRIACGLAWNSEVLRTRVTPEVRVEQSSSVISVDTGTARFWLEREIFRPFSRVLVGGREVLAEGASFLALEDNEDQTWEPRITKVFLETIGPLRSTLFFEGTFRRAKKAESFALFFSRIHFFSGHSQVKVEFTIRNPRPAKHAGGLWDLGDPGSIHFRDLSMHSELRGEKTAAIHWTESPEAPFRTSHGGCLEIYQDSSGGQNWHSRNHVNRFGEVKTAFRGYRIRCSELNSSGDRAQPTLILSNLEVLIGVVVENFWQNFPKALEVRENKLTVRLFPKQYGDVFELQGGEQKTHAAWLEFGPTARALNALAWVQRPLIPRLEAEWYAASNVFPYMVPEAQDTNKNYLDLIHRAIDGENNFFERREIIDEYGWRNFGELYADHESAYYTGPAPVISHYNNQYDVLYSFGLHFSRSGDPRWFELMRDLTRHVIDIDIYHTAADKAAYSGGLFWHTDHYTDAATCTHRTYSRRTQELRGLKDYGGGPSNEHLYTTGLMTYHFMTGDLQAREAVLGLADWVIRMDNGRLTPLRFFSRCATGCASQTGGRDYHGPGRGVANCVNALLDGYRLSRNREYFAKAEELIRRCVHPAESIESLCLLDAEKRWSYLAFLQVLGKYLDCKNEWSQVDQMFQYARESLLHYARWMVEHEVPYSQVMDKVEYPTETWVAHDLRKSNVLEWAALYSIRSEREKLLKKATFFYDNCFNDLAAYATKVFTRPLVLLLHYGYMHSYFQRRDLIKFDDWRSEPDQFDSRPEFRPQRHLAESRLRLIGSIGSALMIGLFLLFRLFR